MLDISGRYIWLVMCVVVLLICGYLLERRRGGKRRERLRIKIKRRRNSAEIRAH